MDTGISDFYAVCGRLYDKLRDPDVKESVTVAAIRDGAVAAGTHPTKI